MKSIKLLPLSLAITAALSTNAFANDAQDEIVHNEAAPAAEDLGFYFSGYARYGAHFSGENAYVGAEGQNAGVATGRLGNEGNGGEFQLGNRLTSENGTNWDVAVMLEHWGDEVGLKKFYAKADNVFASQSGMTVWAGRDFHRFQTGLNDYFVQNHDGQGGGFNNFDLGAAMFDAAIVGQVDGSSPHDNGNYALTTKLHGIDAGVGDLSFFFNYGFASSKANGHEILDEDGDSYTPGLTNEIYDGMTSYQLMAVLDMGHDNGWNQAIVRYADGADGSVYTRDDALSTFFAQWEGSYNFSDSFELGYLGSYHDLTRDHNNGNKSLDNTDDSRTSYSAIVRPMYSWNNIHSTWVEAGYSLVDYKDDGENSAWKVTLSQNISFGNATSGDRPMLRFYATVGDSEDQVTGPTTTTADTFAVGAMWEAWW